MSQDGAKQALVAFGANLPLFGQPPARTISAALDALDRRALRVVRVSRMFRTPCFPAGAGPDYVNAAACLEPPEGMTAERVLDILHAVEAEFGRARAQRWAGRTLDIDLLAWGAQVVPDALTGGYWRDLPLADQLRLAPGRLILPHPRLQDRAFVLVPLAEVAPDWVHPLLGASVAQMLARRPAAEVACVTPIRADVE